MSEPDPTPTDPAPPVVPPVAPPATAGVPWLRITQTVVAMAVIAGLDLLAGMQVEYGAVFSKATAHALDLSEIIGVIGFVVIALVAVGVGIRHGERAVLQTFLVFTAFATIHVIANIAALVITARVRHDTYLWGMWDAGAAYLMIVAVFTGWYWLADQLIPGGAFEFPAPENGPAPTPNLVDYVFISFNTNATFGPTSESVMSRRVKVLMMLQTTCSLVILLVLVARVVGLRR